MPTAKGWMKSICTLKNVRNGKLFDIIPTIYKGHYFVYQRNYTGLHPSGATTSYNESFYKDALKRGIVVIVSGKLPKQKAE
jgi:hypothetical protein